MAIAVEAAFIEKYGDIIAKEIAVNLDKYYPENGYDWIDIVDDFDTDVPNECFGLDDVIDTLENHNYNIITDEQKKELYELLCINKPKHPSQS